ncbi:MAG: hypothetical protein WKF68_14680 [Daejeonella sp.]
MNFKRTFLFLLLIGSASFCLAQSPAASANSSASSQISVRIPSFAIITLADNNSKTVSYNLPKDSKKSGLGQSNVPGDVISNRKWSVNISREENTAEAYSTSNYAVKSPSSASKTASVTVFYVTSLN